MPRYKVRAEAQDKSGHYRESFVVADTPEAARAVIEAQEAGLVAFDASKMPPVDNQDVGTRFDELAVLMAGSDDPKVALRGKDRAHWFAHHTEKPYKIVSVVTEARA